MSAEPSPVPAAGTEADVLIRLSGITKRFPGVIANEGISLDLRRGEVHCLLGENGAGKSTLISMLAGLQQPDAGTIEIAGRDTVIASPAASLAAGIGVVPQHSSLIPTMTVLENLMLGEQHRFWLDRSGALARLAELTELLGARVDPDMLAGDLGLGQQQQIEIARAMWGGSSVLVLDEPTSMLTPQAVKHLLQSVRRLGDEGLAVVFVTHKLREAGAVGDAVTVLRGGRVAARIAPHELQTMRAEQRDERILGAMFGAGAEGLTDRHVGAGAPSRATPAAPAKRGSVVLRAERLSTTPDGGEVPITDVSLMIRAGEILGVAGIDGHGQRHLAEVLAGQRRPSGGRVLLDDRDITRARVRERQRLGVRHATDDRLHEGIVGRLSVALNLVIKRIGERPYWRFGRMDRSAVQDEARRRIADFGIRTPSEWTPAGTLSGGNIQKLLLARELAQGANVVIFHKPTTGLDLRGVDTIRSTVREFVRSGGAALLISTDLDELVDLSDRIVVLSSGRVVGEVECEGGRVLEQVAELMAGHQTAHKTGASS